jgi:soluble lytic murein transglycosylase
MKAFRFIIIILVAVIAVFAIRYYLCNVTYRLSYREIIEKNAAEYNIDEYLLMAMIHTESNFKKDVQSHAGAKGLMQLTDSTAAWVAKEMNDTDFKIEDLYEPETNIRMGAWYFDNLRSKFGGTALVLAAYNAGRGNVSEWLNDAIISENGSDYANIPFSETRNYIKKVLREQKIYAFLY